MRWFFILIALVLIIIVKLRVHQLHDEDLSSSIVDINDEQPVAEVTQPVGTQAASAD
jgi:hypothetical protein